jgi:hypothetical protein
MGALKQKGVKQGLCVQAFKRGMMQKQQFPANTKNNAERRLQGSKRTTTIPEMY